MAEASQRALDEPEVGAGTAAFEELLPALQRLDSLLSRAIIVARNADGRETAVDSFRGLYIDDAQIERLLQRPACSPLFSPECDDPETRADSAGLAAPFERLGSLFGLSSFDLDVLLFALAPEVDLRYEQLYAYLQDDATRRRPTVDLALNLLCPTAAAKLAARGCFAANAPLLRYRLLRLTADPADHEPPLLGRHLVADERVVGYLLGDDGLDARLRPYVRQSLPVTQLEDVLLPAGATPRLAPLAGKRATSSGQIVYLQGPYGVGKRAAAGALCREIGAGLLIVDGERMLVAEGAAFETLIWLALREARLLGALLYWDGFDALLSDERRAEREMLLQALAVSVGVSFLAGDTACELSDCVADLPFVRIELAAPGSAERARLWQQILRPSGVTIDPTALHGLAGMFRLTGGQMRDAVATARSLAMRRDPEQQVVTEQDLTMACRLHSNHQLASLAQRVVPHYGWDDIVLPPDRMQQLREICGAVRYRPRVYDEWGFDRKLALGKGVSALFSGPSGTGKTMAADIIAGDLGLVLYKIDLATVVSKYIGETEKNLARIFAEAETSNAILFFDEADALFGKRSEVKDAHDRYANLEIAYLLQRMEAYTGVTILATNLRKNLDDAFVRRLQFIVEFPFPSEHDRLSIWNKIWPDETPRDPALDLRYLAGRFEIAGGNIRNIALSATFLAAADQQAVTMRHLIQATRREYQKLGKVAADGEFSEYARA